MLKIATCPCWPIKYSSLNSSKSGLFLGGIIFLVTIDSQMISGFEESKSYIADRFQWDRLKSSDLMVRKEPVSVRVETAFRLLSPGRPVIWNETETTHSQFQMGRYKLIFWMKFKIWNCQCVENLDGWMEWLVWLDHAYESLRPQSCVGMIKSTIRCGSKRKWL